MLLNISWLTRRKKKLPVAKFLQNNITFVLAYFVTLSQGIVQCVVLNVL